MSVLTVSELRTRVETAVTDGSLQALIDRIEAEIAGRIGAAYTDDETIITEEHRGDGRNLYLKRKVLTIDTVTEYSSMEATGVTLTENDDFITWSSRGMLERFGNWGWRVIVEYVPTDDRIKWKEAVIDVARIDLARTPMQSESVAGEMSYTAPANWEYEREKALRRLMFTEV